MDSIKSGLSGYASALPAHSIPYKKQYHVDR